MYVCMYAARALHDSNLGHFPACFPERFPGEQPALGHFPFEQPAPPPEASRVHAGGGYSPRPQPAHTHTYTHTYTNAYMDKCIRAYVHTCIRAYVHTCIHAYIRRWARPPSSASPSPALGLQPSAAAVSSTRPITTAPGAEAPRAMGRL